MHGGVLASVALALGAAFRRVTIAASARYDKILSLGHPPGPRSALEADRTRVIHDGCELDVIQKTEIIAQSPLVMETLRVCPWEGKRLQLRALSEVFEDRDRSHAGGISRSVRHAAARDRSGRAATRVTHGQWSSAHRSISPETGETFEATGTHPELRDVLMDYLASQRETPTQSVFVASPADGPSARSPVPEALSNGGRLTRCGARSSL